MAAGMGSMNPAGGSWFSYGNMGQCKDGTDLGTDGCTWIAKTITKAINATCLYKHIDDNIEAANATCFKACPPDPTRMSDCYLECYNTAVHSMTSAELSKPWSIAFSKTDIKEGGCPVVKEICKKDSARAGCPRALLECVDVDVATGFAASHD